MVNSREKGKRGERDWAGFLTENGFPAKRGQQFRGGLESPDVVCERMNRYHPEVKLTEKLNIYNAMDQAVKDGGDKIPYVAHRRNRKPWIVIIDALDFLDLVEKAEKYDRGVKE